MNPVPCHGAAVPMRDRNIFWIEPIPAGTKFQVRIWSPAVWGVWTHYHDATSPCYEDHSHCIDGHDPKTLRWKGYVMGWHYRENKPCFVQLTQAIVWKWWSQIGEGSNLRGCVTAFSRGPKKTSRLGVQIDRYQDQSGENLPQDCDPRKSLYNFWKLPDPGWAWAKAPFLRIAGDDRAEIERVS
jgi:hypothetical protein